MDKFACLLLGVGELRLGSGFLCIKKKGCLGTVYGMYSLEYNKIHLKCSVIMQI